jgi:TonB family protein
MPFFSDTRETSARYGRYITEFQDLCKRHEVSSGTPEDFYRLAPKLAYDERFRADFCTLTRSVAQSEEGHLTLTRILTIIAVAMGGESIDMIGTAGAVPVSLVVVFLAGVGGWSENENSTTAAPETIKAATLQTVATTGRQEFVDEEQEALELERRLAAEPNDLQGVTASLFGNPALVKEALGRLELHTLELKLHLDSIDSRMERIEPHLDDLTSRLSTEPPRHMDNGHQVRAQLPVMRYSQSALDVASAMDLSAPSRAESAIHLPAIAPSKSQHSPSKPQPSTSNSPTTPSSQTREQKEMYKLRRLYRLLSGLAVLVVVMASVLGFLLYNNYGRLMKNQIGRILARERGDATTVKAASTPAASGANNVVSPDAAATIEAPVQRKIEPGPQAVTKPKPVETSKPIVPSGFGEAARKINLESAKEEEPLKPPAIHLADALPGAIAAAPDGYWGQPADHGESIVSNASNSAGMTLPAAGDKEVITREARTKIFVPAGSLVRNAIASPPPIYPSTARQARIEGEVVLQALISEKGMVESVSVVSGPGPLQNAAVEALRRWRFKPYLLEGHPVAVRTFVDFRFKMAY